MQNDREKVLDHVLFVSCVQLASDQSTYLINKYKHKQSQVYKEWVVATNRMLKVFDIDDHDEIMQALNATCTIIREQNLEAIK